MNENHIPWGWILPGIAAIICLGFLLNYYLGWVHNRRVIRDTATALLKDLDDADTQLTAYLEMVGTLSDAYKQNGFVTGLIPDLRFKLDKVKFDSGFNGRIGKLQNMHGIMPWKHGMMRRVHGHLFLLSGQFELLRSSKLSGFMRSARMLEEYLGQKTSTKKQIVENFAEDHYEESIYAIIKSLTAERDVFTSKGMGELYARLRGDLTKISRINPFGLF
ncbi:MAG: hypothetical protein QM667_01875 [Asticcacaulis sp.]